MAFWNDAPQYVTGSRIGLTETFCKELWNVICTHCIKPFIPCWQTSFYFDKIGMEMVNEF